MFGCNKKFHFSEIHFLLTNIYSFDPEIILHSYFQFKSFPEKEREREREREERAQIGERERKEEETLPAIDERCDRLTSALVDRAPRRSRLRARSSDERLSDERACRSRPSSIASLVGRSHRSHLHRAISSSPPLRDLNLTGFDEFFCWVLFLL